jgi:hypothetical protein
LKIRTVAAVGAISLLGIVGAVLTANAANATTCNTTSVSLNNRPDSGVGGNDWAFDTLTRKTEICEVTPGHYTATVADDGTFNTNAGLSPAGAVTIVAGIKGTVKGGFTATFTAPAGFAGYQGNFNGNSYNGTAPSSSSDWVAKTYGNVEGFQMGKNLVDWKWTYKSCSETWVNADAGNSGDITGKDCPSPTPTNSPSPSPSPTTSTAPVPTPVTITLPVTG